jgi:hypothetical protein
MPQARVRRGVGRRGRPAIACGVSKFGPRGRELADLQASRIYAPHKSYDGLVAQLFRGPAQKVLDKGLADGLRYLKTEVEERTTLSTANEIGL